MKVNGPFYSLEERLYLYRYGVWMLRLARVVVFAVFLLACYMLGSLLAAVLIVGLSVIF